MNYKFQIIQRPRVFFRSINVPSGIIDIEDKQEAQKIYAQNQSDGIEYRDSDGPRNGEDLGQIEKSEKLKQQKEKEAQKQLERSMEKSKEVTSASAIDTQKSQQEANRMLAGLSNPDSLWPPETPETQESVQTAKAKIESGTGGTEGNSLEGQQA